MKNKLRRYAVALSKSDYENLKRESKKKGISQAKIVHARLEYLGRKK